MCKKPSDAPILRKSMKEMGEPSRFDRLIATKAHHCRAPTTPAISRSKNTGANAADIGILSTTAEITPIPNVINGIEMMISNSKIGVRISPKIPRRPKISIDPTRMNNPIMK